MRSGIIYKSLRYRNKNKDTETNTVTKFEPLKLNIEPIKKRMCGSSAFKARGQVKLISFNNKSQIGSSIDLTKRNCSYSSKLKICERDNTFSISSEQSAEFVKKMTIYRSQKTLLESLILAQDERWRHA